MDKMGRCQAISQRKRPLWNHSCVHSKTLAVDQTRVHALVKHLVEHSAKRRAVTETTVAILENIEGLGLRLGRNQTHALSNKKTGISEAILAWLKRFSIVLVAGHCLPEREKHGIGISRGICASLSDPFAR